jgi:asparagine synthase (glutamine-hydrolysing)
MEVDLDTGAASGPRRYWDLDLKRRTDVSFPEAGVRVRELFLDNVRLHLRSDVPVGAALSGGIDSSAIVAAKRAIDPRADVHTFTFVADDPAIGEEQYADLAAKTAGATAHKVRIDPGELAADLDRLMAAQDEPFGSTSIYAQYRVFRLAAETGVKVMLDGQGADELLAGYHGYFPDRLASLIGRGEWLKAYAFARRAARRPGVGRPAMLLARSLRRLLPNRLKSRGGAWLGRHAGPGWLNHRWFDRRGAIGSRASPGRGAGWLRERLHDTLARSSLPALLRYEDRNSMAWSIESRVPFLTPALAEFVLSLPEEYLISSDGMTKHVFREAMRGIVPDPILDRRDKIGFATPEKRWLTDHAPWVSDVLSPARLARVPALDAAAVVREWGAVQAGTRPFDSRVWRWVNLVRWAEAWDVRFD